MKFPAAATVIALSAVTVVFIMPPKVQTDTESHAVAITEAYQKGLDEGKALGHTRTIIREVPAYEHRDTTSVDERAPTSVINNMCAKMTGHKGHHVEPSKKLLACQDTWYREFNYVRNVVLGKELANDE